MHDNRQKSEFEKLFDEKCVLFLLRCDDNLPLIRRMSEFEQHLSNYAFEKGDGVREDGANCTKHLLCNGVQEVLHLLELEPGNVLIDLGCGMLALIAQGTQCNVALKKS